MSDYLLHAQHNKKACEYLFASETESFPDWVVTTAFYSAMHYVNAAIFPFSEVGTTYKNFEAYFNKHKKNGETKHSVTFNLVQKKLFEISHKYKTLKDVAHTARYHDYNIDKRVVKMVRQYLNKIETHCEEICAKKTMTP